MEGTCSMAAKCMPPSFSMGLREMLRSRSSSLLCRQPASVFAPSGPISLLLRFSVCRLFGP